MKTLIKAIAIAFTLMLSLVACSTQASTQAQAPITQAVATQPTQQAAATAAPKVKAQAPKVKAPKAAAPKAPKTEAQAPRCEEDMPCWDCKTMGNGVCGSTGEATAWELFDVLNAAALLPDATTRVSYAGWQTQQPQDGQFYVTDGHVFYMFDIEVLNASQQASVQQPAVELPHEAPKASQQPSKASQQAPKLKVSDDTPQCRATEPCIDGDTSGMTIEELIEFRNGGNTAPSLTEMQTVVLSGDTFEASEAACTDTYGEWSADAGDCYSVAIQCWGEFDATEFTYAFDNKCLAAQQD